MTKLTKKNAILVIVSGVLFLAVAVFSWVKTVYYRGEGVHADAEIVDIDVNGIGDDEDHDVIVKFTTEKGEEITGKLDVYKSSFYEGKIVPVLYIPDDPNNFTYEKNGLLLPLIFGAAGVALVVFGVIGLARNRRGYDDGTDFNGKDPEPNG